MFRLPQRASTESESNSDLARAWDESVVRSRSGVPELPLGWVIEHSDEIRLVDVREPVELLGELGAFPGAENVPLGTLAERVQGWDRDRPLVLVCRSGARSGRAALALEHAGFRRVASLEGGMLAYRATQADEGPFARIAFSSGRGARAPKAQD